MENFENITKSWNGWRKQILNFYSGRDIRGEPVTAGANC